MSDLFIHQFEMGHMANFNYFIGSASSKKVAIVDPWDDTKMTLSLAEKERIEICAILLTHGHYDHVGGVTSLSASLNIPVYLSEHEADYYTPDCPDLIRTADDESIPIGGIAVKCIHTPGHTPGGQCFYSEGNLITGDTLFVGAVGRTDLQGGDTKTLFNSLQKIKQLPKETIVWPGHDYGRATSASLEELTTLNPYFACRSLADLLRLMGD